MPPPLDDTPEALHARNHAAIAKVAALLSVNANEIDLAAQCITARAQAEDLLRLLRQHASDIGLVILTSLSVHGRLMRVQTVRQKREKIEGATNQDSWAQHVAERSMLEVVEADAGPPQAAWIKVAPVATHVEAPLQAPPVEASAACEDERVAAAVSEIGINSQGAAFETGSNRPAHRISDTGRGTSD